VKKYEKKSLRDFIGDKNYAICQARFYNKNPPIYYGDVKDLIQTLVLGSAMKIKSLCIIGPPKCGKKFLVHALCTEMDAVLFDLSAPVVKDIEDMPYFLNLVMQMAVKFQPSVLLIDGAHKPFIKKISDEMRDENPKKLGKFLSKNVVKNLTVEDTVVLIGLTNDPSNCNFNSMRACYEKFVVFPPKLDAATASAAWKCGLRKNRIYNFDVSSLAQPSCSFSIGDILDSINSHLNLRRRMM
jgi:IQ and AAA domain-containing protein